MTKKRNFDVELTKDGDLPEVPGFVDGDRMLEQKLRIRLNRWRGENPTDTNDGLPFARWIQEKPVNTSAAAAVLRQYLEEIQEVQSVRDLSASVDRETRTLEFEGQILTTDEYEDLSLSAQIRPEPNTTATVDMVTTNG